MKRLIFFFGFFLMATGFSEISTSEEMCKQFVNANLAQIPGWCSVKKSTAMMDLIFKVKPETCVEIGVFGGSSLFPTATALKHLGNGLVYAIDPWDVNECIKYYPEGSANRIWWSRVDMSALHRSFSELIRSYQLQKHCIVLRETSIQAASKIGAIDILHIDGNHCDESELIHVTLYLPKVKVGGYVWFDGWASTPQAFEYVKKTCYVKKVIDEGRCILLEKVFPEK